MEVTIPLSTLTLNDRQLKIWQLIADGLTNQEIADKLFYSKRTIEGVRADLLEMTGCKNSAALVAFGLRNSIIK